MGFANYVFQKLFHIEWEHEITIAEKFERLQKDFAELHAYNVKLQMKCKRLMLFSDWYEKSKSEISLMKIKKRDVIEVWLDNNGLWDGIFIPKPVKIQPSGKYETGQRN